MNKQRMESLIWVLIYGGVLAVCVSVFLLRAGGGEGRVLGWLMLAAGVVAAGAGAALVLVRARMEVLPANKKGRVE